MKSLVPLCISVVMTGVCLFAAAGRIDWWNAWVLLGLSFATGIAFTAGRDPELSAERRNVQGSKSWDRPLVGITVLLGPMAIWITSGLDQRFRWSNRFPLWVILVGVGLAIAGGAFAAWAMRCNRFFSSVVRIQKDRGHIVVADGPYRFVRHPGYAGMGTFTLATPLILGSYWALAPAGVALAAMVLRTALEDRTLRDELEGYSEYARRVRYRLAPGLW